MTVQKLQELGSYQLAKMMPVTIHGCMAELESVREQERALFNQLVELVGKKIPVEKLSLDISAASSDGAGDTAQDPENGQQEWNNNPVCTLGMLKDLGRTMTVFSDGMRWGTIRNQVTMNQDNRSSPLIDALKKVEHGHKDYDEIAHWCTELARTFCLYDDDNSGHLEEDEYLNMIHELPLSDELKNSLSDKFESIDIDNSGWITLKEFLFFFLSFPPMKKELGTRHEQNEPYRNTFNLSICQELRLWIFKVVTVPDFNLFSRVLYCVDMVLSLIPFCMLYVKLISANIDSEKVVVLWFLAFYFSIQWVLGLLTCMSKIKFIFNGMHFLELISFVPWMVYNLVYWKNEKKFNSEHEPFLGRSSGAIGFFLFRILRVIRLPKVFSLSSLKKDIDIYVQTINLALTSYKPMGLSVCFLIIFLSTLIYAFERGQYDGETWVRGVEAESESPFANFFNCVWYTLVTGTTLGYGDIYPKSYEGKLVGILIVILGLVNITVIINTIGQCFEEIFRDYLENRSKAFQEDRARYIKRQVEVALGKMKSMRRSKTGSSFIGSGTRSSLRSKVLSVSL